MPASYKNKIRNSKIYSSNILKSIIKVLEILKPVRIIMEPGRFLVADAGVIETEVILSHLEISVIKKDGFI